MVECPKCRFPKNQETDFHKNRHNKNGYQRYCKTCQNKAARESAKLRVQTGTNWARSRRFERQRMILNYLNIHPCIDCGEADPLVLQFDHTDRLNKSFIISNAMKFNIDKLLSEMAKCEIRCANCHLRKHAKENNNIRYQLIHCAVL